MSKKSFKKSGAELFFSDQRSEVRGQRVEDTQDTQDTFLTRNKKDTQDTLDTRDTLFTQNEKDTQDTLDTRDTTGKREYYRLNLKLDPGLREYVKNVSWERKLSITEYINELIRTDKATKEKG